MFYICSLAKAQSSLNREDKVLRAMSSGANLMLRLFILYLLWLHFSIILYISLSCEET